MNKKCRTVDEKAVGNTVAARQNVRPIAIVLIFYSIFANKNTIPKVQN